MLSGYSGGDGVDFQKYVRVIFVLLRSSFSLVRSSCTSPLRLPVFYDAQQMLAFTFAQGSYHISRIPLQYNLLFLNQTKDQDM